MEKQFVAFMVENNRYCIDIMEVQEVIRESVITHMPNFPDFVEGIINVRGVSTPIVSVLKKMHLPSLYALNNDHLGLRSEEEFEEIAEEDFFNPEKMKEHFARMQNKSLNKDVEEEASSTTINKDRPLKLIIIRVDQVMIGLHVHSLDKILTADESDIQDAEGLEKNINSAMVAGLLHVDNEVYIVLNTRGILEADEKLALTTELQKQV